MLRKLARMIEDEDYINRMSQSGKKWDMRIEDFLGNSMKSVASDNDKTRLGRVVEAILSIAKVTPLLSVMDSWWLSSTPQ